MSVCGSWLPAFRREKWRTPVSAQFGDSWREFEFPLLRVSAKVSTRKRSRSRSDSADRSLANAGINQHVAGRRPPEGARLDTRLRIRGKSNNAALG
jgi:hypothetical protein